MGLRQDCLYMVQKLHNAPLSAVIFLNSSAEALTSVQVFDVSFIHLFSRALPNLK